jgi:hypothetical protein
VLIYAGDADYNLGRCRGCMAEIVWCRRYPDKHPLPFNLPMRWRNPRTLDGAHVADADPRNSHFATCPKRDRFKREPPASKRAA